MLKMSIRSKEAEQFSFAERTRVMRVIQVRLVVYWVLLVEKSGIVAEGLVLVFMEIHVKQAIHGIFRIRFSTFA